jgi:Predicted chitinase
MKTLSPELLHKVFKTTTLAKLEVYTPYLNEFMGKYSINSVKRVAAFLAQIGHESAGFQYTEEIASGSAYEFRKDLGNLEQEALEAAHQNYTTTGKWYKGRGLIQITGFYNYRDCGEALELDLIGNPKLLTLPPHAVESACWFWEKHNCNFLADVDKFTSITKVINGGTNGLADREKLWKTFKEVLE